MSQNGGGPDFHLPDEVLGVIPTDPYDQLDLARKITSMAIASRVSKLESETTRLKQQVHDQDRLIFELEEKASNLQQAVLDSDSRLKTVLDENMKLVQERDSLAGTVKKLSRDLGKALVYPTERNMDMPAAYAINSQSLERNAYTHQQELILVDEYPERPGQPECSYFLKTGNCKYRSACKFHHPKSANAKPPPCSLSDLGLPLRPVSKEHPISTGTCSAAT